MSVIFVYIYVGYFYFNFSLYNFYRGDDVKKLFIDFSIDLIKKNCNYSEEQIEVIVYGLEGIYLTITKMIVLVSLAYILGILKEFFLILIFYNIIRVQAFGIHASKSIYCLISSTIMFIGGAFICKYVYFPFWLSISIAIICDICLLLYAPADTSKRPIINKKKRIRFKCISFILGVIYTFIIIFFRNNPTINYLVIGMLEAVLMILPITYKIFKLPYNNYKNYSGV